MKTSSSLVFAVLGFFVAATFAAACGTSKRARSDGSADAADTGAGDTNVIADTGADANQDVPDAQVELPIFVPPAEIMGPWSSRDIGAVGDVKGSLTASSAAFTVRGGGAAVGGTADAFFFTSQTLDGDGEIIARVKGLLKVKPASQIGIMIRASDTEPGAPNVFLSLSGDPAVDGALSVRADPNGATTTTAAPTAKEGQTLRLVRTGKVITAYNGDGQGGWSMIGVVEASLPAPIFVGLAVSGADPQLAAAAEFDLVRVSNLQRGAATKDWSFSDLGTIGSAAIAAAGVGPGAAGTITMTGLGERTGAASDVGILVLQTGLGAQTITAHLTKFAGGGVDGRVGLMVREGKPDAVAGDSAFAFIGITPSGGTQFHSRSATGTPAQAGVRVFGVAAPAWIRLEKLDTPGKNESVFTGFYSPDGVLWNLLDTRTFTLREPYSIGLVLLAGSVSSFASATFGDITVSLPK